MISDLPISLEDDGLILLDFASDTLESDFDTNYGLLKPEETVLIRAYSDDTDDRMLTELKPKFIVMFEPDMDFVRRVEVSLYSTICKKEPCGLQWYRCIGLQKF